MLYEFYVRQIIILTLPCILSLSNFHFCTSFRKFHRYFNAKFSSQLIKQEKMKKLNE